jgi:hypothetical protein
VEHCGRRGGAALRLLQLRQSARVSNRYEATRSDFSGSDSLGNLGGCVSQLAVLYTFSVKFPISLIAETVRLPAPAVKAGVINSAWTVGDLVAMIEG